MSTHGPFDEQWRPFAEGLMGALEECFGKGARKRIGLMVLMFPLDDMGTGRMNYISNARREDMVTALKELIANFEGRVPDVPQQQQ